MFALSPKQNLTIEDLPPTSYAILGHIKKAYYTWGELLIYLDGTIHLDPKQFGYGAICIWCVFVCDALMMLTR